MNNTDEFFESYLILLSKTIKNMFQWENWKLLECTYTLIVLQAMFIRTSHCSAYREGIGSINEPWYREMSK